MKSNFESVKKPAAFRRKVRFSIDLDVPQRDRWKEAAAEEGFPTLSRFLRHACDEAAETGVRIHPVDRQTLKRLETQLRIVGRNVNVVAMQLSTLAKQPLLAGSWREQMALTEQRLSQDCDDAIADIGSLLKEISVALKRLN